MVTSYTPTPHPWTSERKQHPPTPSKEVVTKGPLSARINSFLAVRITNIVGTMWCAYGFGLIAIIGLPAALGLTFVPARVRTIVLWVSSEFLQLVLLSVIIVGQNIQASASDKRSEATYKDADAVLHEAREIQRHLQAQDAAIQHILGRLEEMAQSDPKTAK
jgi:hypothetical protein